MGEAYPLPDQTSETIAMLAKYSKEFGAKWDTYLQHLLFAYQTKSHELTMDSPFFLLYGRDARLPIDSVLDTLPACLI